MVKVVMNAVCRPGCVLSVVKSDASYWRQLFGAMLFIPGLYIDIVNALVLIIDWNGMLKKTNLQI